MEQHPQLLVYKASAGSGKTFTLAVRYIKQLIENVRAYRNILAVTFTNKATAEMKERILSQLYGIATGDKDSDRYLKEILKTSRMNETDIRQAAEEALRNIIHDYNRFRIETIDSFFQSVMRNLARELELGANLSIELNDEEVLNDAVDTMIENLEKQKLTIDWQKQNGRYIPYPATWLNSRGWENEIDPQELVDISEKSVSRLLAIELYETLKNTEFTLTTDTKKLIKSWMLDIEEYLSFERTREREDRIFYAIKAIEKSDKWRKIIVDARSLIKNIEFIKE